jgi:hypothetical protein
LEFANSIRPFFETLQALLTLGNMVWRLKFLRGTEKARCADRGAVEARRHAQC